MIERLQQRTRQMAHSCRERAPDIFLVLLVVLVMASAVGVAQTTGGTLIDDFEDGDISDWQASDESGPQGELVTDDPIEGDNSFTVPGQTGAEYDAYKAIDSEQYDRMSFVMEYGENSSGESFITYNRQPDGGSSITNVGFQQDGTLYQSEGDNGPTVAPDTPIVFVSEFNWTGDTVTHTAYYYANGTEVWSGGETDFIASSEQIQSVEYHKIDYDAKIDVIRSNPDPFGGQPSGGDTSLSIDTRDLFIPGNTHPYTVYQKTVSTDGTPNESTDVTDSANVTTDNSSLLTVNDNGTMSATNDENASAVVNVTAEYEGENVTKAVVVAQPTVDNLEILPTGITRVWAVGTDNTIFILLIAAFMGVAATRFAGAFAGLATAEMVIVIGWLGGYVGLGMAMVSVFMALFIGLNLAANIDYSVRR